MSDYDFQATRNDIIQRAFRIIGVIPSYGIVSSSQLIQGVQILNSLVKFWQSRGTFVWTQKAIEFAITAGTKAYSLEDHSLITLDEAMRRDSGGIDAPMEVLSWHDYNLTPNKNETGVPYAVAVDHATPLNMYVWPVPDIAYTLLLLGTQKAEDWDYSNSTGDFSPVWMEPLIYGVAAKLSDEYGLPIDERRQIKGEAEALFMEAKKTTSDTGTSSFIRGAY